LATRRSWLGLAESVGKYLAEEEDKTVTFMLGAGASRSSGAPSTEQVLQELCTVYPDDFSEPAEVRRKVDRLNRAQVDNCIRPLFRHARPHVGYLSLAALAKSVRVLVVNLNWDPLFESACKRMGIEYAPIHLDESRERIDDCILEIKECLADARYQVVDLHVHGRLDDGDIRLAERHTLQFDSKITQLLWEEFFFHPTVVAGASLSGEHDVTGLLAAASQGSSSSPKRTPFWLFSRQPERTEKPESEVADDLLSRNESKPNFAGEPYVDFDRVMVELLASFKEVPLSLAFADASVREPKRDDLILPSPKLLRDQLNMPRGSRYLALVGEEQVGKSTTARMLVHWASLQSDGEVDLKMYSRHVACKRGLEELSEQDEIPPGTFVVLDDPFGKKGKYEQNQGFVGSLVEVLDRRDAPWIVITSCPSNWRKARLEHSDLAMVGDEIVASPTDWYRGFDLAVLADNVESRSPAMVTRRVLEGVASTPARVAAENAGEYPEHEDMVVEEKLALLRELDLETKQFLTLIRFYELSSSVVPKMAQFELIQRFQDAESTERTTDVKHMLVRSELDDEPHWRFAHYTDRAAFDQLYAEEQDTLRPCLNGFSYHPDVVRRVCRVWLIIAAVRNGNFNRIGELSMKSKRDWGPLLLEEAANSKRSRLHLPEVLELLPTEPEDHDFWSLRELTYEVVRLWPELHEAESAQEFLDAVLWDDCGRLGKYCVLESLLYFQDATHSATWGRDPRLAEVWERFTAARWDLINEPKKHAAELGLIFDAIAWYRPPIPEQQLHQWLLPLLDVFEKDAALKGMAALTCLYHPAGLKLFEELGRDSPLGDINNLSEEQVEYAAALVRWHHVHQSRGRALLTRRRLEPAEPDYLRRTGHEDSLSERDTRTIQKFVERMAACPPYAGWAVHLGFNLRCTTGKFDDDFLGRCVDLVESKDDGLVTAVLTYWVPGGALEQVRRYFKRPENRSLLLKRMREGCAVECLTPSTKAHIAPPRFAAWRDPHAIHHQLATEWPNGLAQIQEDPSNDPTFESRVFEILEEARDEDIIDEVSRWELAHLVQSGDHSELDGARAHDPHTLDPRHQDWLKGRSQLTQLVIAVVLDIGEQTFFYDGHA
jgi:hypothetical protein